MCVYIYIYKYTHMHVYTLLFLSVFFLYDSQATWRVYISIDVVMVRFTDGMGTPDPNPRHLANWCF